MSIEISLITCYHLLGVCLFLCQDVRCFVYICKDHNHNG